jgi:hypothetical protein
MRLEGEIKENSDRVNKEQVYELLVTKVKRTDEDANRETAVKTPTVLEQQICKYITIIMN